MHLQYVHTAAQESVASPFHWNCWPCFVQYHTFFLWCECRDTFPWGKILPFWKVTMAAIICWSVPKLALQTIELAQSWYMPLSKLPEMCSWMYLNCKYRMLPSDGEQTKVIFLTRWYWGFLRFFYFYFFNVTPNAALQATCVCVRFLSTCMCDTSCVLVWQQKQNTSLPVRQASHPFKASNFS